MAVFAIDDDYSVVRRARLHLQRTVGATVAAGLALVAGLTFLPLLEVPALQALLAVPLLSGRRAWLLQLWDVARLPVDGPATLATDDDGITFRHPALRRSLTLLWSDLRAYAAAVEPEPGPGWRDVALCPVHHPPGSRHPLEEPRWAFATGFSHP